MIIVVTRIASAGLFVIVIPSRFPSIQYRLEDRGLLAVEAKVDIDKNFQELLRTIEAARDAVTRRGYITAVLPWLPFSRQDLAAMTGTTVETVSRVMSHFSEAGWISTGRKWVIINDAEGLKESIKKGAVN